MRLGRQLLFSLLFLLLASPAFAAAKTWDGGGADELASNGINWSGDTAPAAGDDVTFDATSVKNCTWDIATDLNTLAVQSGYTGIITATAAVNVNNGLTKKFTFNGGTFNSNGQAVTVGAGGFDASGLATKTLTMGASVWTMSTGGFDASGTGLTLNANTSEVKMSGATNVALNVGSKVLNKLTFDKNDSTITTVTGTVACAGTIDIGVQASNITINGGTLEARGDVIRSNVGASNTNGTTLLKFAGTGAQTWSIASVSGSVRLPIEINKTTGTLTLSGVITFWADWTYVAGTVATGTSEIVFLQTTGANITITDATTQFYKVTFSGGPEQTTTLATNVFVTNTLDLSTANSNKVFNGNKFMCSGNVTISNVTGARPNGTTTIEFTGTAAQTWDSVSSSSAYGYDLAVIVNKSGGTLTVSGTVIQRGNFTYTAGTVSTTGSTFNKGGDTNLNSGTIAWNNLTIVSKAAGPASTVTLTGNLDVNGTLTINASQILSAGANQINCAGNFTNNGTFTAATSTAVFDGTSTAAGGTAFYNLTLASTSTTHLTSSQTFSTNAAGTFTATSCTLDATTPGTRAILTVNGPQSVSTVTATDIDSSAGNQVVNTGGTNSNTVNWVTSRSPQFFMVF